MQEQKLTRPHFAFILLGLFILVGYQLLNNLSTVQATTNYTTNNVNLTTPTLTNSARLPGFKNYLMLGVSDDNSQNDLDWIKNTAPWDMRYQYLTGNVNVPSSNWTTWNTPSGQFATIYLTNSKNLNTLPVFTYYSILNSSQGSESGDEATLDYNHLNNTTTMRNYYANFKLLMDKIRASGLTTVVHIEPDMWGYMEQRALQNSSSDNASLVSASVNSSGYGDVVAGLPNNVMGFAQALVRLRDKYAPNALLAYHDSEWGTLNDVALNTDPTLDLNAVALHSANFFKSLNANFDLIFNDVTDRDAAWYAQYDGGKHWWDENNLKLPNFVQYASYLTLFHQFTQKPIILWQLPVGNSLMRTVNNTNHHWQDNRAQYFLGGKSQQNLTAYVNAGVVGLLFGPGSGSVTSSKDSAGDGVTNPTAINGNNTVATVSDDDGGYLRQQAAIYYKTPYYLPPPSGLPGCLTSCTNIYNLPVLANQANGTTTYVTLQNTSSLPANITLQYYNNTNGIATTKDTLQIPAKGQTAILPNLNVGDNVTSIASSDQPLTMLISESTSTGGSAYNVTSATATTLYDPIALNGNLGFTTALTIFNAGSNSSSGSIQFYDQNGNLVSGATQSFQIASHASQTFNQATSTALSNSQAYWAKISGAAGSQLTAQVLETNPAINFVATFNTATQLSSTLYTPAVFKGAFGFYTGMELINPNTSAASATITYSDTTGSTILTQTVSLAAGGGVGIFHGSLSTLPANFNGSAKISSTQPLAITVNENGGGSKSGTYTALSKGSQIVNLPVMAAGSFGGYYTGTTLLNLSSSTATLTFQYLNQDGTNAGSKTYTLAPAASLQLFQGNTNTVLGPVLPTNYFGTAVISSSAPEGLAATTNALNVSLFYTYTEPSS
jgi:hypothetical protein